jgi:hypothetical protein
MDTSLKIIKKQLQSILKRLEWNKKLIANGQFYEFIGLSNIREVINDIISIGLFEDVTSSLKKSVIFTSADDSMRIGHSETSQIEANLILLKTLSENFSTVLLKTVPEEDLDSINIKLPEVNDFDELSKVSREIHLGLTQVIFNDEIKGQTKIVSVENGSIWLNVLVGSTAVRVIASLVWSSAVIYKKIQEGKLLEQQVRGLKVKNDSLEDILKAQKAETELMISAEAQHIDSEHFKKKAPENIGRIKNSITTFADLIGRGAEIHPALVAPESVSNLFPDPTKLVNLESKIKKLISPSEN